MPKVTAKSKKSKSAGSRTQSRNRKNDSDGTGVGNHITAGNFENVVGVAVGNAIQVQVSQIRETSADEIARSFAMIMRYLNEMPDGVVKEDAKEAVGKLETEAGKGEAADEDRIQRWLTFLAEVSSDAWDVAVTTLSNPALGLGTAFKKILERARQEKARREK